jgi:hypothetical protein
MSKDLKYTTWSSIFFAYINLTRRGLPLQEVCQVDIMCKRQLKYYRQLLDEKSLFTSMQGTFYALRRHRMALMVLLGLVSFSFFRYNDPSCVEDEFQEINHDKLSNLNH